ncbi:MAG: hypothetical protein ACE5SW_11755 [Nitrososphaeraceae archaeon]
MQLLWREAWIKPLIDYEINSENCSHCKGKFTDFSFVTSCEFCDIGLMHDECANFHILHQHHNEVVKKISRSKEKQLHDFQ